MRPDVNIDPNERAIVRQYAKDNGLTLPNAYAELLRQSLRREGYIDNNDEGQ